MSVCSVTSSSSNLTMARTGRPAGENPFKEVQRGIGERHSGSDDTYECNLDMFTGGLIRNLVNLAYPETRTHFY